ncbi:MAG: hypothetical protein AAF191_10465, partial [Verrucomicrobiota bacterium]
LYPWVVDRNPEQWDAYVTLPGGKESQSLRRARLRLLGEGAEAVKPFWKQQGLLQIFQDFCLRDFSDCAACPFPEQAEA